MKNILLPMFLAATAMTACNKSSPKYEKELLTQNIIKGYTRLDDSTVCLIEADNISKDINVNKELQSSADGEELAILYFRINKDSSVVIQRGVDGPAGNPVTYPFMEKSVQGKFAHAVKFAHGADTLEIQ